MSENSRSRNERSFSIAERGHVPFAILAVLLLVSSVAAIAILEQRSEPRIDRDAELAMDRTETAAQSEFRTAVLEATHQAGGAPINSTAGSDVDAISSASDQSEAFRNYVKLLIYLEAADRLPTASQSVSHDTYSTVSVVPVSDAPDDGYIDPGEAIQRVDLEIGHYDDDVENGTVIATIQDVEFSAYAGGERVPAESRSITVSVGTPVFELNEKLIDYEAQLNAGFFEDGGLPNPTDPDGLGQELGVRLYPNAYMKASWNRFGAHPTNSPDDHDFEEVIHTDHTEVLTNQARFSIQEETFGTRDPYADRTMRPQYLCMALDVSTTVADVDLEIDLNDIVPSDNITFNEDLEDYVEQMEEGNESIGEHDNITVWINEELDFEEEVCDEGGLLNDWVFGDEATGDLPDVPPVSELLRDGIESMDVAEQEIELPVNDFSEASYLEYRLGSEDPIEYFEAEIDTIQNEIENEGGLVDEDVPNPSFDGEENYDASPHDIRDELYELSVTLDHDDPSVDRLPTPNSPGGSGWERTSLDRSVSDVSDVSVLIEPTGPGDEYVRDIYELEVEATTEVDASSYWVQRNETGAVIGTDSTATSRAVDIDVEFAIQSEYAFEAAGYYHESYDEFRVADDPIETDYDDHENVTFRTGARNAVTEVTGVSSYDTAESQLRSRLESTLDGTDPDTDNLGDVAIESVKERDGATLKTDDVLTSSERAEVLTALDEELEAVHNEFQDRWDEDPHSVKVGELTQTDETPPEQVKTHIQNNIETDLVDDGPYETPEEKARQQIRSAYFDRLYYWLDLADDDYNENVGQFDDTIDGATGGGVDGMNDALDFVQGFANADFDPEPEDLDGSPVHDDAQYEISGSPTYLTSVDIDRDRDPAIRGESETIMDTDSDAHHAPMAIQTDEFVPWPGSPALFYLPNNWYVTINSWTVDVRGEYARLEVSSTIGDPADSDRLTYVAEESPVYVDLSDDSSVQAGRNEAVDFETYTEVIVIMPGAVVQRGGPVPSVADGQFTPSGVTFCSETWEEIGPDATSNSDWCIEGDGT
ncbi:DUF7286 family protein [Natrarchaeobaculum sulfurireducens]|uniref:Uncharacterized protein n=1 Tax=Natrarchaeobaculum sulfurireducens TaxID=2044521 RepID=A0A346PQ43_9EURY|nr:hypothetical protein [Natrarchaeobaculum sulfurireducens]AXR81638.1 hypothetical protein AArcMg_1626 [Natrarchaeobaculum sulfurireducens]